MKERTPNIQLRRARLERHWSQSKLAEDIGVTSVTINHWERGVTFPSPHFRTKLVQHFAMSLQALGLESSPNEQQVEAQLEFLSDPALPFASSNKTVFLGRKREREQLQQWIAHAYEAIAVTGLPGIGKTSLILELAHTEEMRKQFPDGFLWVGLGREPHVLQHFQRWGRILGMSAPEMSSLTTQEEWVLRLREQLLNKRMLLLIDDAWDIAAALLFKLGGRHCVHLLTSRFPTLAFSFAPDSTLHLQDLSGAESRELLERLAPQAVKLFPGEIETILQQLGGLPLSLSLIGHYLHGEARTGQHRRLANALGRISESAPARLSIAEHQSPYSDTSTWHAGLPRSLYASLHVSVSSLPENAQRTLSALAVFPPKPQSFSEETALFVCETTCAVLDQLVDCGLLEPLQDDRYMLHPVICDYASLQEPDSAIPARFISWMINFVRSQGEDSARLNKELPLVLAACGLAFTRKEEDLIAITFELLPFLLASRLFPEATRLLKYVQQLACELALSDDILRSWLFLGLIAYQCGDTPTAKDAYTSGLTLARLNHVNDAIGQFLVRISSCLIMQSHYGQAQQALEEALPLIQLLTDRSYYCLALKNLGEIAESQGRMEHVQEFYEQGLAVAQEIQHDELTSCFLQNLGNHVVQQGQYAQANQYYQQGLYYAQRSADKQREAALLMNLGMLAFYQGQIEQAIDLTLKSLSLARLLRHRIRMSGVLQNLGMFERIRGRYEQAAVYLQESLHLAQEIEHHWLLNETRGEIGWLYLQQHKLADAQHIFQTMLVETTELYLPQLIAQAHFGLAHVFAARKQYNDAKSSAQASLALFTQLQDQQRAKVSAWLETLAIDEPVL